MKLLLKQRLNHARALLFTCGISLVVLWAGGCSNPQGSLEEDGDPDPNGSGEFNKREYRVSITPSFIQLTAEKPISFVTIAASCENPLDCIEHSPGWAVVDLTFPGKVSVLFPNASVSGVQVAYDPTSELFKARLQWEGTLIGRGTGVTVIGPENVPDGLKVTGQAALNVAYPSTPVEEQKEKAPTEPQLLVPRALYFKAAAGAPDLKIFEILYTGPKATLTAITLGGDDGSKFVLGKLPLPIDMADNFSLYVAITWLGTTGPEHSASVRVTANYVNAEGQRATITRRAQLNARL
jgi:hypothetical protein